ncbi:unnamed protein product [Paramecium sonneborni]|uniref:Uncharacterized protein n=1 Tax=Paramecium sonneborni TaxID=65129 RepID=A0A8S1K7M8_9CILI|nr:unnamed protein product [Paramecium sonneborni]
MQLKNKINIHVFKNSQFYSCRFEFYEDENCCFEDNDGQI